MDYEGLIQLRDKVVAITGAASGIGLATAELFAEAGAHVVMLDIDEPEGRLQAEKLGAAGYSATFIACDVTCRESCRKAVSEIEREFGRLDVLFNNAGIIKRKTIVDHTEKEWDAVVDVSLKSIFLLSKYAIPLMAGNNGGSIINNSSGWGLKGGDNAASYCAAKAGVVNLTRAMAIDHGKDNIRVNCICPGDTDTPMLRGEARALGLDEEEFLGASGLTRPLQRVGKPRDVAYAVLFFASALSSWVTGATLVVDGGGLA